MNCHVAKLSIIRAQGIACSVGVPDQWSCTRDGAQLMRWPDRGLAFAVPAVALPAHLPAACRLQRHGTGPSGSIRQRAGDDCALSAPPEPQGVPLPPVRNPQRAGSMCVGVFSGRVAADSFEPSSVEAFRVSCRGLMPFTPHHPSRLKGEPTMVKRSESLRQWRGKAAIS